MRSRSRFSGRTVWSRKITREEIQDELMAKFKDFPAINFNFSQLIRDNVEEALSGVKGANSIKLFGNDLATPGTGGTAGRQHPEHGAGDLERRSLPHRRSAEPRNPDRPP